MARLTLPITNEGIAFTFEICYRFASSWTKKGSSFILCCCTIKSYLTKIFFFQTLKKALVKSCFLALSY